MSCMAAKRASPLLPSSFLFAFRMDAIWRLSLDCFRCFVLVTPLLYALYTSSLLTPDAVPAAVPCPVLGFSSSSSSDTSPAAAKASAASSCPRKNLSAPTSTRGAGCRHASATKLTVRASLHTLRRYKSVMTASAFFAAVSFSSLSAACRKFCTERFNRSSRFFLFAPLMSATIWRKIMMRSCLSGQRKRRKKSGRSSVGCTLPRLRSRMSAATNARRRLGSSSA
mmetsp:Transcript_22034/g.54536  ORF Transcript_22034/g.54536 Transcript_22034/m.54536 type:complete len:225 (+) Transcript_22034:2138-2812(+)